MNPLSSCYSQTVQITVELPDDITGRPDPGRAALEALAIDGYRSGALTHYQASQLLGLTRFEFDGFLKERNIFDHAYEAQDLERDVETLRRVDSEKPPAG
jgi:predicted HTH domain antitoxin